jgi:hypothetical protein
VARLRCGCESHASLLQSASPQIRQSKASRGIRAILRPLSQRGSFSLILPILLLLVRTMLFLSCFGMFFQRKAVSWFRGSEVISRRPGSLNDIFKLLMVGNDWTTVQRYSLKRFLRS